MPKGRMENKMYIGMRGHDFDTTTLDALLKKCNEYNVGGVQLALLKSLGDFKKGSFTPEYAQSIGDAFKAAGVRIPVLGCYINPSAADKDELEANIAYFIENLHYAKYLGADMVGLETCTFSADESVNQSEETYQYLLKNMKRLVAAAEELGVIIGIEGVHCHVVNRPEKMKRLVEDLNSPNVRVIFDPVNYINSSNYENQDEIINTHFDLLGDITKALHLKDFKLVDGNTAYEFPCDGILNKELVWKRAKEFYPDIPVILEETKEDVLPKVKASVEAIFA